MADVVPFKGVLFNIPGKSNLSGEDLLAPPYDIITPEYQDELYRKSPYNIVRIDYGREYREDSDIENKYTRARDYLNTWLKDEVLVREEQPCFYAYEISYVISGMQKKLRGFLCLVRLEELGKGNIYPHECTHSKPKKDRLDLLRICDANISPIFSLYNSSEKKASAIIESVCRGKPYIEARDVNGSAHRLWVINDTRDIEVIRKELENKTVFIADGHHRYETALDYQKEVRGKEGNEGHPVPQDYVLMFLSNMSDEGLTILPTHRLARRIPHNALERLGEYFDIEEIAGTSSILDITAERINRIGLFLGNTDTSYVLDLRSSDLSDIPPALRTLDVSILHELIFKKLLGVDEFAYEMDAQKTLHLVKDGEFSAAFFLNPTRVEDVEHVALASLRMPPKSTYFYPKLLTGLVLNKFNNTF